MQQQLMGITNIPEELQSKITMVTQALEKFMMMDNESTTSYGSYDMSDSRDRSSEIQFPSIPEEDEDINSQESVDDEEPSQSYDHYFVDQSTRETSYSLEDLEENEIDEAVKDEKFEYRENSVCESIKSEEELKIEEEKLKKQQKIQTLEQSWQRLCGNTKTIYK